MNIGLWCRFPSSNLRFLSTFVRMTSNKRSSAAARISRLGAHLLDNNNSPSFTEGNNVRLARMSASAKDVVASRTVQEAIEEEISSAIAQQEEEVSEDWYQPNETWSQETLDLYNQLKHEAEQSGGKWNKLKGKPQMGENRLFTRASTERGKMFEYALFTNKTEQQIHGVVQCGPYTEGPKGHVHGGAIATLLDIACGVCVNRTLGLLCVTANLSVNYKVALPLNSTVLLKGKVDHVAGRKVYSFAEVRSADGTILYATATALFIEVASKLKELRAKK